jgi:hypothetical protein
MSSALRDAIRGKVFSAKRAQRLVPVGVPAEGEEQAFVEVVQPSVGQMTDTSQIENPKQRIARMIIDNTFVPGTSEQVFEEADFDSLMNLPAGGMYQELMNVITDFMAPQKQAAEAKNG